LHRLGVGDVLACRRGVSDWTVGFLALINDIRDRLSGQVDLGDRVCRLALGCGQAEFELFEPQRCGPSEAGIIVRGGRVSVGQPV
jgi:hypothetical protein